MQAAGLRAAEEEGGGKEGGGEEERCCWEQEQVQEMEQQQQQRCPASLAARPSPGSAARAQGPLAAWQATE